MPSILLHTLCVTLRILGIGLGLYITGQVIFSAIRTFLLPRSSQDRVSGFVFLWVRRALDLRVRWVDTYAERDRIMAFYAPISLFLLLPFWLTLVTIGMALILWALGLQGWWEAFTVSGSSLLTLGFARGPSLGHTLVAFVEATIGLILVALLIAYFPTMYAAFARRENAVTRLAVRAGTPPSAQEMLLRFHRLQRLDKLGEVWTDWEIWFSEIEESHSSLAALVFFRSPQPDHSWITAAGAVLDTAALAVSIVDIPHDVQADLCIRAGYLALRRIADFFDVEYPGDPTFPEEPISIARSEFEAVYQRLQEEGVPVKADRDQAWLHFAGWRVNYDHVLLALCAITMAPYAPWSSDRSQAYSRPRRK